jgi:hypothetical protein
MLKKVLTVFGVLFLVIIVSFGGMLFWAQRSGSELQARFFEAVGSGDPQQVTALFHPLLRDEVDEPVLAAWMAEVHDVLGTFQGLSKTDFATSSKLENSETVSESEGTVNFEKGSAKSKLVFRNSKVVEFSVESDQVPPDWFKGPADSKLYRQRGEQFLKHFLNNEPEQAFAMMHEALQKELPLEALRTMIESVQQKAGGLKSLEYLSDRFDNTEGQTLKVLYQVDCEDAQTTAEVDFRFIGLKGHLIAFNMAAE